MQSDLVFDLGLHRGEDTAFYLKKGFRVVGVEANRELCNFVEDRFSAAIADGRLTVVNRAIASSAGPVTFYRNVNRSVWGTIDPEWAARNARLNAESTATVVEGVTMLDLINEFGVPYYLKVDIEGLDLVAVKALSAIKDRPKYISIEADKDSFGAIRGEISTLQELGYNRFKIVDQRKVPRQKPPRPAKEGKYAEHRFEKDASGLFGEEAPGRWLTAEQAIETFRPIFLRYALTGDDAFVRSKTLVRILQALGFRSSWYDTHARLGATP